MIRSVDSPHYHVWTDALHARHLAETTANDWDRGTYVRWAINSAWTAFEMACEEVLSASGLGMRFKDRFDEACTAKGISVPDWGSGLWQQVLVVYGLRKDYVHPRVDQDRLFAAVDEAQTAITVLREAVNKIHSMAGEPAPEWVEDDQNPMEPGGFLAHGTVIKAGVDPDGPETIKITYVFRDQEHTSEVLPPGSDFLPRMEDLLRRILIPVTAIRAYRGAQVVEEWQPRMRGA